MNVWWLWRKIEPSRVEFFQEAFTYCSFKVCEGGHCDIAIIVKEIDKNEIESRLSQKGFIWRKMFCAIKFHIPKLQLFYYVTKVSQFQRT